ADPHVRGRAAAQDHCHLQAPEPEGPRHLPRARRARVLAARRGAQQGHGRRRRPARAARVFRHGGAGPGNPGFVALVSQGIPGPGDPLMRLFLGRALVLVVLSWLAIEIHEAGHFLYYTLAGFHARMSLQQVTPAGDVPMRVEHAALLAGPAVSAIVAIALLFA